MKIASGTTVAAAAAAAAAVEVEVEVVGMGIAAAVVVVVVVADVVADDFAAAVDLAEESFDSRWSAMNHSPAAVAVEVETSLHQR